MQIILASKSPARQRLLKNMGVKFSVLETNTNERNFKAKTPASLVQKITLAKAKSTLAILSKKIKDPTVIITADSIVYVPRVENKGRFLRHFPHGPIIGKAKSKKQAAEILKALSGTTHRLYTGLCVAKINPGEEKLKNYVLTYDLASVTFRNLTDKEIQDYIRAEESTIYAGAYTIERHSNSAGFVEGYKGSLNTIIGLPTRKLEKILKEIN